MNQLKREDLHSIKSLKNGNLAFENKNLVGYKNALQKNNAQT